MDIEKLLGRATDTLSVGRAFGTPVEHAGTVVIPVAWVAGGGGGGAGDQEGDAGAKKATGRGGGFGGVTWPLGAYVVKDGAVRWVPATDATRIVLGVLVIVRLIVKARTARRAPSRRAQRREAIAARRAQARARRGARGCSAPQRGPARSR